MTRARLAFFGLGLVSGFQAATQVFAWTYRWSEVLGPAWRVGADLALYPPWAFLIWRARFGGEDPQAFSAGMALILLGAAAGLGLGALCGDTRPTVRIRGWGRLSEARKAGLLADAGCALGLLDGRLLSTVDLRPTLVTGGTRSGKGRGHVIPSLLFWGASVLVHDPKKELWQITAGWRSAFSHALFFDPRDPASARWNPLAENLADLLPVSAVWAGPARDTNLDGPPLATARTTGSTPFRLVLHVGDVGHAMVVGPTGSGKSALLSFLALQWFRYPQARVIFFDKGRSARAATLAAGGRWRALEPGADFSLQPLARIYDDGERAWASEWIAETVRLAGLEPVPRVREEIWAALAALAEAPVPQRTLTVFCALVQDKAVAAALEPLTHRQAPGVRQIRIRPKPCASFRAIRSRSAVRVPIRCRFRSQARVWSRDRVCDDHHQPAAGCGDRCGD